MHGARCTVHGGNCARCTAKLCTANLRRVYRYTCTVNLHGRVDGRTARHTVHGAVPQFRRAQFHRACSFAVHSWTVHAVSPCTVSPCMQFRRAQFHRACSLAVHSFTVHAVSPCTDSPCMQFRRAVWQFHRAQFHRAPCTVHRACSFTVQFYRAPCTVRRLSQEMSDVGERASVGVEA